MDAWRVDVRSIELVRGNTLTLEQSAGASVSLVDGSAWLSGGEWSRTMRAGEPVPLDGGMTLIYAFAHASLRLEVPALCAIELRRRGEVAAMAGQDDQRVNLDDPSDVARWAEVLGASPEELRKAIQTVGPRIGDLKRYFLIARLRRQTDGESS